MPNGLTGTGLLLENVQLGEHCLWAAWERLDNAGITHIRYLGILPQVEGETTEALTARALGRFPREERT